MFAIETSQRYKEWLEGPKCSRCSKAFVEEDYLSAYPDKRGPNYFPHKIPNIARCKPCRVALEEEKANRALQEAQASDRMNRLLCARAEQTHVSLEQIFSMTSSTWWLQAQRIHQQVNARR